MRGALLTAVLVLLLPALANAQNQPPVANAGPDRNAYTGETIRLAGGAYDPDGEPIVYWVWIAEQAPANADFNIESATTRDSYFTAFTPGDYVLSLTVGDPTDFSAPDFVTIHVADNIPPVAVATADRTTIRVGETVCFDGSQSYDPEGGPLTHRWNFADGSPLIYLVQPCHTYDSVGTYSVGLLVVDERAAADITNIEITVLPAAAVPSLPRSGLVVLGVLLAVAGAVQVSRRVEGKA